MRATLTVGDYGACGLYRIRLPAYYLSTHHDITLADRLPIRLDWINGQQRAVGAEPLGTDVLILQRPLDRNLADAIPHIQAHGTAVVVEIDDDLHALHPHNQAWPYVHPKLSPTSNIHHLAHACRQADLVTVTTPALARRYAPHGRYRVLPNVVPEWLFTVAQERTGGVVGWSGTIANHPGDLETAGTGINAALHKPFHVVGIPDGVQTALRLDHPPTGTGWLPYEQYIHQLATLDIGVVPLADTAFNHGKSALKGLEMAALGIPYIASPTPDYRRLHNDGIGYLAAKPKQWQAHITRLLNNPTEAADTAAHMREQVALHHTYTTEAWRWAEAWEQATINHSNRGARSKAATT